MLIGQFTSKLTEKERISVPKKLRKELGKELIIARWYENCLVLVSKVHWQRLMQRLSGVSGPITTPARNIERFVFGMAFEISLDAQGRFVVPDILRLYAEIKSEVVFVGLGDRVEIWSIDKWKELEKEVVIKAAEAIDKIAGQNENAQKAKEVS